MSIEANWTTACVTCSMPTGSHIVIHGDSKQGKTWLRKKSLPEDKTIRVQCTGAALVDTIFREALGQLGIRAEIRRTSDRTLEGELDFTASAELGARVLARARTELHGRAAASRTQSVEEQPIGRTPGDLSWIASVFVEADRRLVLEDFHYLETEVQREFSYMLKALGEYECFVTVIGVWPEDHLLSYFNGDLTGRVEDIRLEWTEHELRKVLAEGGSALNVEFSKPLADALIDDAYGNVGLLQRLAEGVLSCEGVRETLPTCRILEADECLNQARRDVAASMAGRFFNFADRFTQGLRRTDDESVYSLILRAMVEASDIEVLSGLSSATLCDRIKATAAEVSTGRLRKGLRKISELQGQMEIQPLVLSYDPIGDRVSLVDRQLLFYRKYAAVHWPWEQRS